MVSCDTNDSEMERSRKKAIGVPSVTYNSVTKECAIYEKLILLTVCAPLHSPLPNSLQCIYCCVVRQLFTVANQCSQQSTYRDFESHKLHDVMKGVRREAEMADGDGDGHHHLDDDDNDGHGHGVIGHQDHYDDGHDDDDDDYHDCRNVVQRVEDKVIGLRFVLSSGRFVITWLLHTKMIIVSY